MKLKKFLDDNHAPGSTALALILGVSKPTITAYYRDRPALLQAIVDGLKWGHISKEQQSVLRVKFKGCDDSSSHCDIINFVAKNKFESKLIGIVFDGLKWQRLTGQLKRRTLNSIKAKNKYCARTYSSWRAMKEKCKMKGITLQKEWELSGEFAKDMSSKPINSSLAMIDKKLGYIRGNCEWKHRVWKA